MQFSEFCFYTDTSYAFTMWLFSLVTILHHFPASIAEIAQLGERQTEDLKVPGSNPENSHEF